MSPVTLLITLEPFEALYSSRGIAFTVLLFREAGEKEGKRKEEWKRYDSVAPLATIYPAPFLHFLLSPLLSPLFTLYKGMFNT